MGKRTRFPVDVPSHCWQAAPAEMESRTKKDDVPHRYIPEFSWYHRYGSFVGYHRNHPFSRNCPEFSSINHPSRVVGYHFNGMFHDFSIINYKPSILGSSNWWNPWRQACGRGPAPDRPFPEGWACRWGTGAFLTYSLQVVVAYAYNITICNYNYCVCLYTKCCIHTFWHSFWHIEIWSSLLGGRRRRTEGGSNSNKSRGPHLAGGESCWDSHV